MAIDIGEPAIDRWASISGGGTFIALGNPANTTGKITTIEIWANTNLTGVKVATFFEVSAGRYSTRDYESITDVVAGSKQTRSVDIDVETGDFIGIYWSSGSLEWSQINGLGVYYLVSDEIPCSNTAFDAWDPDGSISLYGTDITVTITTLAPTLVEDGIANLRLELEDKGGLTINPVGWYCDENATPTTEYTNQLWQLSSYTLPRDLALGEYYEYIKTLPTGQSTLYVQAWADDSDDNRYTGSILSFDIPTEPEYLEFPDFMFPEFNWNWDWELPDFDPWDFNLPELPPWIYWDFPDLPPLPPWYLPELSDWEMPDYPSMSFVGDFYYKKPYTHKDIEGLKQKCINYEKNYTDLCLTINHNTLLAKNFLQSVYNNGVLGGENEMFAKVYPSQQLTPLYLDPLKPNDFKEIINRFINNNISNALGLNHNFDLFTEWLNDYNYTSDGYKASYITLKEETIIDNKPTVEYMKKKIDKLQKEISVSSKDIGHNFNLIKEIIQ